jgi:hypothetical protein
MTLQTYEKELEALDNEAHAIAPFVASLSTWRLHMIGQLINDELALRSEGKPMHKNELH